MDRIKLFDIMKCLKCGIEIENRDGYNYCNDCWKQKINPCRKMRNWNLWDTKNFQN